LGLSSYGPLIRSSLSNGPLSNGPLSRRSTIGSAAACSVAGLLSYGPLIG
jgi:hypothetical protein